MKRIKILNNPKQSIFEAFRQFYLRYYFPYNSHPGVDFARFLCEMH